MIQGAWSAIAVSLLSAVAEPVAVHAPDPRESALESLESEHATLFARVAPSVVLLLRDGVSGSGFVVGRDGLVLTNAHVVGDGREITVQTVDGRRGIGRVIARATGTLDLALVQAPFDDLPPLAAGVPGALRTGTFAATVGHGGGAAWTFSTGLVANPRPLGEGAPMVLAQMALRPGSSGGPLVDRNGRAVAVVTAGTRDASGVTFAIRIDAAAAAFPQLASWAAPPVAGTGPYAVAAAPTEPQGPPGAADRGEPEPRGSEVAELSGVGRGAPQPRTARVEQETAQMVTVWEAPRPRRRVAARALRAPVASHPAMTSSAAVPPPPPAPLLPQTVGLLAIALVAGATAGRFAARSRSR